MASSINTQNINGSFPIAGQDNDSQGFRDNFTNIRNNFTTAQREITELQSTAVLLKPLSGGAPTDNNFNGTVLVGAQTRRFTETAYVNPTPVVGDVHLTFAEGTVTQITTGGPIKFVLNWDGASVTDITATPVLAKMQVWVNVTNPDHTIEFPLSVVGTNVLPNMTNLIMTPNSVPSPTIIDPVTYLFEFSTIDLGTTVALDVLVSPLSDTSTRITAVESGINTLTSNIATNTNSIVTINNALTDQITTNSNVATSLSTINSTLTSNVVLNNASNHLHGNIIQSASTSYAPMVDIAAGTPGTRPSSFIVDVIAADIHHIVATTDASGITFINWPANAYRTVRILINVTNNAHTITLPTEVTFGMSSTNLDGGTVVGTLFTPTTAGAYMFEVSSFNGGTGLLITQLMKP